MAIGTLAAVGLGSQALGIGLNMFGQNQLRRQAKQAGRDLRAANNEALGAFDDLYSFVEGQETLNIDRSMYDAMQEFAQNEAIAMEGRATGEETMRDSLRQTTADQIQAGINVAGSGTDALGVVNQATVNESEGMNRIDAQAAQQRLGQINQSKNRLFQAMRENARFNDRADLLEFQSRTAKEQRLAELAWNKANMERGFALDQISQDGATASATAGMWGTAGQLFGAAGGTLNQMDFQNQYMNMMGGVNDAPLDMTVDNTGDVPLYFYDPSTNYGTIG